MALVKQGVSTVSPEVEDARAELDSIEGRKSVAQTEILAIAQDKKNLETAREESIARLDSEITTKEAQLKAAGDRHDRLMSAYAEEEKTAIAKRDAILAEIVAAETKRDGLQSDCATLSTQKQTLTDSIKTLSDQQSKLIASIAETKRGIEVDEKRLAEVKGELVTLSENLTSATAEHAAFTTTAASERSAHAALVATKDTKQQEVVELDRSITEKSDRIITLNADLAKLEAEKTAQTERLAEQDKQSNERMRNAALLEERVDIKLTKLKEAEAEFTTSHLARIGYNKIDA